MVSASYTTQDISSLRAAALLTLRSKPKSRLVTRHASLENPNPDDASSTASTRKAAPSPELDYGSDDASANEMTVQADEEKKTGEKEEGEISDDEAQRATKPTFSMMDIDNEPLPGLNSIGSSFSTQGDGTGTSSSSQSGPSVANPPSQPSTEPRMSEPRSLFTTTKASVNAEHARPSLQMTAQELAEAKEIILDLLGWNVPPDYLINCGLTKEAIYYVFTELNLRLPRNIDFTRIFSYDSPKETETVSMPSTVETEGNKVALPTPVSGTATASLGHSSPSLSPTTVQIYGLPPTHKPLSSKLPGAVDMYSDPIPGLQSQRASSSTPSQPSSPTIPTNGAPTTRPMTEVPKHNYLGNLDEIETLRRQELLARKAALASRRKLEIKKQMVSPSFAETHPKALSETPIVPIEAVDDFLNSIVSATPAVSSPKEAAVDIVMTDSQMESLASPVDIPVASESHTLPPSKKSTNKRAVAADWIDHESSPRNTTHLSLNGNGRPLNIQRSSSIATPSFANLLPNRKVVIDFSDSEDDLPENSSKPSQTTVVSTVETTLQTTNAPSEATSISTFVQQAKPMPSSDVLLLKEQEIKRMKELIAERERTRLKALSKPPQSVTPPPTIPSPALSPSVNSVKGSSNALEIGIDNSLIKHEPDETPSLSSPSKESEPFADRHLPEDFDMNDDFSTGQTGVQTSVPTDFSFSGVSRVEVTDVSAAVTAEHEHEQVVPPTLPSFSSPYASKIDITSSPKTYFTDYISPLSVFPVTQAQTLFITDSDSKDVSSPFSGAFHRFSLDRPLSEQILQLLRPLRSDVVSRLDPMQLLCPFEIPGGGKCQDSTCVHIHLRDFEPTDDEIAQYLSKVFSAPQLSFQMIRTALSRVRASKQDMNLDNRVLQALDHLGVR